MLVGSEVMTAELEMVVDPAWPPAVASAAAGEESVIGR
jgi:hypothetical protein